LADSTDHRYHYARWDGTVWQDHEIVPGGKWFPRTPPGHREREIHYSGGVVLDHEDPDVVYLSRPVNGVFEIERRETMDLGFTWKSQWITNQSKYDNVRPFVPWFTPEGAKPHVLWMNNYRYVHYSDYQTDIRMDIPIL
ncbi:hypothetical protein BVY01_02000, partial [bacterium I07]